MIDLADPSFRLGLVVGGAFIFGHTLWSVAYAAGRKKGRDEIQAEAREGR